MIKTTLEFLKLQQGIGNIIQTAYKYLKDNESLHNKLNAYHRRLDTHGDDLVRLNTKAELAITAKEVDEKYLSKEMFRQFEKHIDGRFDGVETSLQQILNFIKKD